MSKMRDAHRVETEALQREIGDLTSDLQRHSHALTSLSDKSAILEQQLCGKDEAIERKSAEIQVTQSLFSHLYELVDEIFILILFCLVHL